MPLLVGLRALKVFVATIAVLNFFKDTLEGLSVELVVYFEDGTDNEVNNWNDIHENNDSNLDKIIKTFSPRASG